MRIKDLEFVQFESRWMDWPQTYKGSNLKFGWMRDMLICDDSFSPCIGALVAQHVYITYYFL